MLDLGLCDCIRLTARPPVQRLLAEGWLRFDYRNVELELEGTEKLPTERVIFAMNHTDNFNYWPFQYELHRRKRGYTATWVKGKNYEHPFVSLFMRKTNNIPLASRGYVITRDFLNVMGRRPDADEYRALRSAVDKLGETVPGVPREVLETPRDMLGRAFDPTRESYAQGIDGIMDSLNGRFVALNERALAMGLDVLVFPQGTRSIRLSRGHIGLAQLALHLGATIVPVGCNGSDRIYSGKSIITKPGRVVYRIGEPMPATRWTNPAPGVAPLSRAADAHREAYQTVVDEVMDRINDLLDERYQYTPDRESEGTRDVARFV
ncbi:MAG: lysophospholipid acyltransferase family protein [Myxococcota bacterium]